MWEASWVKLAGGSILAVDSQATTSERYVGSSWVSDALVPVMPFSNNSAGLDGEEGPAFLLPNGNAIFIGVTHYTAIYQPGAGGSAPGSWIAGPPLILPTSGPGSPSVPLGAPDAPGAMMVNGKILLTLSFEPSANPVANNACPSQNGTPNSKPCPRFFYEYDYSTSSFAQIHAPAGGWSDCGTTDGSYMLDLPDGTILYHPSCNNEATLYVYQPDGVPLALGQPQISSIKANPDGTYYLTGTGLNGISEGAAFGDDAQMSSNYPLVRLTDIGGNIRYARTYNWSSTGVQAGAVGSTDFALPPDNAAGRYEVQVVANGNPSASSLMLVGLCPPNDVWDAAVDLCVPAPTCPMGCKYGCIYTPPIEGPPRLVCKGGPLP